MAKLLSFRADDHTIRQAVLERPPVLEPTGDRGIIYILGPIMIPRIPLVQWVQNFREIARPGTFASTGFFLLDCSKLQSARQWSRCGAYPRLVRP